MPEFTNDQSVQWTEQACFATRFRSEHDLESFVRRMSIVHGLGTSFEDEFPNAKAQLFIFNAEEAEFDKCVLSEQENMLQILRGEFMLVESYLRDIADSEIVRWMDD